VAPIVARAGASVKHVDADHSSQSVRPRWSSPVIPAPAS
jgi:hypothetical protein